MPLEGKQQEKLLSSVGAFSALAANSLSKLLNNSINLNFVEIGEVKTLGAVAEVDSPSVLHSSQLGQEELGNVSVLLNQELANQIASLMTGSELEAELDQVKQDALNSAISQTLSDSVQQSPDLDESFNLVASNLQVLDPENPDSLNLINADADEKIALVFAISSEEGIESQLQIDISVALATALAETIVEEEKSEDEETVGDVLGTDFAQIIDSHDPDAVDEVKNLNLLLDIRMGLIVELGRAEMHLRDILKLTKGSIIELDRLSGEPVDLFVNNKLIARGEVVVIDDNFGLRITQLAGANQNQGDTSLLGATDA